jgi:hypothetical protein
VGRAALDLADGADARPFRTNLYDTLLVITGLVPVISIA